MTALGRVLARRRVVPDDRARTWWERAADAGDAEAMRSLGELAWSDDAEAAAAWFRRAAEAGDTASMEYLALRSSPAEAEEWYRRAAVSGSTLAMASLADIEAQRGRIDVAEHWYRRAAEAEDGEARPAHRLARFLDGQGRFADAEHWFRIAAEQNAALSGEALADLLAKLGRRDEAGEWYRRAERARRPFVERATAAPPFSGLPLDAIVVTAVVTAAIVPFVQTLVSRAAADGYDAVRALLVGMFREHRRGRRDGDQTDRGRLLIVRDPRTAAELNLRPSLSDEAIRALEALDVDALLAEPGQKGKTRVAFNPATRTWEVRIDPD